MLFTLLTIALSFVLIEGVSRGIVRVWGVFRKPPVDKRLMLSDRFPPRLVVKNAGKAPHVFRILGIGDSFTYGAGVEPLETWPAQLEQQLQPVVKGSTVEAINGGYVGLNAVDEAGLLLGSLANLKPDLVIWAFYRNDPEPASNYGPDIMPFYLPLLTNLGDVSDYFLVLREKVFFPRWYEKYERILDSFYNESSPSWAAMLQAMNRVRQATADAGIPIIVFNFPVVEDLSKPYPFLQQEAKLAAAVSQSGMEYVPLRPELWPPDHPMSNYWASTENHHPNALGYLLAVQTLINKANLAARIEVWAEKK